MTYQQKYERLCVEYNDMRTEKEQLEKHRDLLLTNNNRYITALRLYANETQWVKARDDSAWKREFYEDADGDGYLLAQQALQGCKL